MGRIYRRGHTWHARWTDTRGEAQRASLRTTDRAVAQVRLRQLELATTDPAAYSGHTLGDALDALFLAMATGNRETLGSYQTKGRHLERLLDRSHELARLTRDNVSAYARARLAEGAHPETIRKELVVLRRTLKEASDRGLWKGDTRAIVPTIKSHYHPRERWLTRAEADGVTAALSPPQTEQRPARVASMLSQRLWFQIAIFAGLRDSEIDSLRWRHVDFGARILQAPGTKTRGAWRKIPIGSELLAALEAAARRAEATGAGLDDAVVESWTNVRRDLGIALTTYVEGGPRRRRPKGAPPRPLGLRLSPNDLRRTFASWLVQAGVPLLVVARLLGHSSTRMVERVYGHLSDASYRDAIDKLPGCAAGVQHTVRSTVPSGTRGTPSNSVQNGENPSISVGDEGFRAVPRDGIEPPTRGFSGRSHVPFSVVIPLRKTGKR